MPYSRDRTVPTADLASRLLDAVAGIRQEAEDLRQVLTGPQLPVDEKVLGRLLGRLLAVQAMLHGARKELLPKAAPVNFPERAD
jgi:hypothetical protein